MATTVKIIFKTVLIMISINVLTIDTCIHLFLHICSRSEVRPCIFDLPDVRVTERQRCVVHGNMSNKRRCYWNASILQYTSQLGLRFTLGFVDECGKDWDWFNVIVKLSNVWTIDRSFLGAKYDLAGSKWASNCCIQENPKNTFFPQFFAFFAFFANMRFCQKL